MATITTNFNETNINIANNTSDLTITCYFSPDNQQTYNMSGMALYCTCNGVTQSATVYLPLGGSVTQSFTFANIQHDNDGTKSVAWEWRCNTETSVLGNIVRNGTQTLSTIPRYTTITTFTAKKRYETSLTVNWGTSDAIDYRWYRYKKASATSYNSWKGASVNNLTSGSFNITSLQPDTTYNIQLRVRRADSQLETYSQTDATETTYPYPSIVGIGSDPLTIGNSQTLYLNNPLNRNVTIRMYQNNTSGTQLYSGTSNSDRTTFTPNATTLYNSIPNDPTGYAVYTCTYSISTFTTGTYAYKIRGDEYPTFGANNWSYSANLTSLTNNNQVVIDKYSTITVNIGTAATSNYGASISRYVINWGNATPIEFSGNSGSISGGNGNNLVVTAIDSRGLPTQTNKIFAEYIPYSDLIINNNIKTDRNNGIEAGVKLSFDGTMFNGNFGSSGIANNLVYAKYYVSTDNVNWSSAYPSDNSMLNAITRSGGNFSLTDFVIHANGYDGGFAIGTKYYVAVELKDAQGLLSDTVKISIVPDGKVARTVYQDNDGEYHEGINGLPDANYTQIIHGNFKAEGGYEEYSATEQVIGKWYDGKTLYMKVVPFTTGSTNTFVSIVVLPTGSNIKLFDGYIELSNNSSVPLNIYYADSDRAVTYVDSSRFLNSIVGSQYANKNGIAIVKYTKTTD